MSSDAPIVIDIPYREEDEEVGSAIDALKVDVDSHELDAQDRHLLKEYPTVYIIRRSTEKQVKNGFKYVDYLVYVGETNSIVRRTREHYTDDVTYASERGRTAWKKLNQPGSRMLVICQKHFNKSLTLDLENNLLSYLLASGDVRNSHIRLVNGRGNPQDDYYTKSELASITSKIWRKLHRFDSKLFQAEAVIRDSAIFKASPFHALGKEQLEAEDAILAKLRKTMSKYEELSQEDAEAPIKQGTLIVVEGMAGTGKTVLLSHLFLRVMNELGSKDHPVDACLLVNHKEQVTVYNAIMRRLGLQNKDDVVVSAPTKFINKHSEKGHGKKNSSVDNQDYPTHPIDIAFIDEAHLLLNEGNQGYRGSRNMLIDIMRRARVVVAVYDLAQVLRKSQEVGAEMRSALFPEGRFDSGKTECPERLAEVGGFPFQVSNLLLRHQYRIDADEEVIEWIDDFANGRGIGAIPKDRAYEGHKPYEIRVFEDPFKLRCAIEDRALTFDPKTGEMIDDTEHGLSRMLATYDWPYSSKSKPKSGTWEVEVYREECHWVALDQRSLPEDSEKILEEKKSSGEFFHMPWNYETKASGDEAEAEKGQAWAEQGHTLGECGSIYTIQGFDLNYAGVIIGPSVTWQEGKIVFDPSKSCNSQAINGSSEPVENLKHELNVLLKRGVHGLYLFAVDERLEEHLLEMQCMGMVGSNN